MANEILTGIVGSTAYGLAHENSDVDRLGVFITPTAEFLKLRGGYSERKSIVTTNPDKTLHEVGKFLKLVLNGNPTVSELLWLDSYEVHTNSGLAFVDKAHEFLSQRIRNTYGGYAMQQLKALEQRGDFGSDLKKRQEKHGRHCSRLLIQGQDALENYGIRVKLSQDEVGFCREMGQLAVNDVEKFSAEMNRLFKKLDNTVSLLPQEPNWGLAEVMLLDLRRANYA